MYFRVYGMFQLKYFWSHWMKFIETFRKLLLDLRRQTVYVWSQSIDHNSHINLSQHTEHVTQSILKVFCSTMIWY